ncbi:conserved hypothetical protein [Tenacibaculum sp. 190524A02b]|uniref:Lipoprotein n=1 Tax=Tenacibaculum vairaonense TaxID=3137860 RepID=A0ABM9PQ96_9FLAO
MKIMKLFGILILTIGLTQCGSMKPDQEPPFTIKEASVTNIIGGMPGNNSTNLDIIFFSEKNVVFEKLYFADKITQATVEEKNGEKYLIGRFNTDIRDSKYDLNLHSDPKKEYGNKPPQQKEKLPFELKKGEAAVSYKVDKKTKYFKIKNIKRKKDIFMQ